MIDNVSNPTRATSRRTLSLVLAVLLVASLGTGMVLISGCALLGVAANALPQYTKAKYSGLAGQSVGVMVWADRGILIDWDPIQLDLANALQGRLQTLIETEELKGATFPVEPRSIIRYQRDHPEIEALPINDVAGKFGVSRLVYVEIVSFRTRSETELELFRGTATATLKVIAIDPNGVGTVVYTEENITTVFPRKTPPDGVPTLGDRATYVGTVRELADEISRRLATQEDKL